MVTYEYRCEDHGTVEVRAPIGEAAPTTPCPRCGRPAAKLLSTTHLSLAPRRLVAEIDRTAATADRPEVVTSIPTGGRRRTPMAPPLPSLQRLPRP